jgi:putative transposase
MVFYRRNRLAGGTYFFTVALRDRRASTLVEHIGDLRAAARRAMRKKPWTIEAWVVLPEHLHALWTLPPGAADYSRRWQLIEADFTHRLVKSGVNVECGRRGEYRLWQSRFWEHTIQDETDLAQHADYIHDNPVKYGWVTHVAD